MAVSLRCSYVFLARAFIHIAHTSHLCLLWQLRGFYRYSVPRLADVCYINVILLFNHLVYHPNQMWYVRRMLIVLVTSSGLSACLRPGNKQNMGLGGTFNWRYCL
jgi:hypothetical protein